MDATLLISRNWKNLFLLTLGVNMSVSLICKSVLGSRRAFQAFPKRFIIDMSYSNHFMDYKRSSIPSSMKKMMVTKRSPNFRQAVSVETVSVPTPSDTELLIRNRSVHPGFRTPARACKVHSEKLHNSRKCPGLEINRCF